MTVTPSVLASIPEFGHTFETSSIASFVRRLKSRI